jgi:hypothetical protein
MYHVISHHFYSHQLLTTPLTEPCLRYLRTRLLDNTLHLEADNKFTVIRGVGSGYNLSSLLNFSQV